eukprot:m.780257 g.780257  ORF g.780257 m.780257 type:complete len:180 (-) comp23280_c2_seq22:244-783(-)
MLFYADAVQRLGLVLPVRFLVLHSPLLSLLLAVCPRTHAFNAIALCGIQAILQWLQEGALRAFVYVWQTDEVADDASLSVGATPHAHTQGPVALHAGKSTAQLIQDLQTSKQAADAGHSEALAQLDVYKKQLHTVQVDNTRLHRIMAEKDKQIHDVDQILQVPCHFRCPSVSLTLPDVI